MNIIIGCGTDKGEVFGLGFNCESGAFAEFFFDSEAHLSAVTSMAVCGDIVISGSRDGSLQSHSVEAKRRTFTFNAEHDGEITKLDFAADKTHLFSSSNDGTIIIWRKCGQFVWNKAQALIKHKKGVISFALHPSDKLALSIGKDDNMRVWNLCHAKQAHKVQTRQMFTSVVISTSGTYYALSTFNIVQVYDFAEASLKCTVKLNKALKDIRFVFDDVFCVSEMSKIVFYRISDETKSFCEIDLYDYKCRQLSVTENDGRTFLISNVYKDADTTIQVYELTNLSSDSPVLMSSYEVPKTRISSIYCDFK